MPARLAATSLDRSGVSPLHGYAAIQTPHDKPLSRHGHEVHALVTWSGQGFNAEKQPVGHWPGDEDEAYVGHAKLMHQPTHPRSNTMTSSIRTCLWFRDGRGREAAEFYCALIPGSRIESTFEIAGERPSWLIDFTLGGVPYQILDAGPMFTLSEAVSISVETDDQAETDRLWSALTENGGEESHCGWLKDRYGVSWQVFPRRLMELTLSTDNNVSAKAIAAMMKQMKIDIAEIEAAIRA
jgi:predicted 3-demethylubiquinone-9 3-methyltransferase (glyoxalase superfamily)